MRIKVGSIVTYISHESGTVVSGYVAELFISPLSGEMRARVVDTVREMSDEGAGRTMYAEELAALS